MADPVQSVAPRRKSILLDALSQIPLAGPVIDAVNSDFTQSGLDDARKLSAQGDSAGVVGKVIGTSVAAPIVGAVNGISDAAGPAMRFAKGLFGIDSEQAATPVAAKPVVTARPTAALQAVPVAAATAATNDDSDTPDAPSPAPLSAVPSLASRPVTPDTGGRYVTSGKDANGNPLTNITSYQGNNTTKLQSVDSIGADGNPLRTITGSSDRTPEQRNAEYRNNAIAEARARAQDPRYQQQQPQAAPSPFANGKPGSFDAMFQAAVDRRQGNVVANQQIAQQNANTNRLGEISRNTLGQGANDIATERNRQLGLNTDSEVKYRDAQTETLATTNANNREIANLRSALISETDPNKLRKLQSKLYSLVGKPQPKVQVFQEETPDPANPLAAIKKSYTLTTDENGNNVVAPLVPKQYEQPVQASVDLLKKNPAMAQAFDQKYGAGASAKALGK